MASKRSAVRSPEIETSLKTAVTAAIKPIVEEVRELRSKVAELKSDEPLPGFCLPAGRWLTRAEFATAIGRSISYVNQLQMRGDGPPAHQPGGRGPCLYLSDDIRSWLEGSRVASTADAATLRRRRVLARPSSARAEASA